MIGYIKGSVILINDNEVIIEAGQSGVGYRVLVPSADASELSEGTEIALHIYTQVREDAIELYGFRTRDERTLFTKLLTVKGVGAKSALAILNTLSPAELQTAVLTGDTVTLKKVPGIGPKAASLIVVELQNVLKNFHFAETGTTENRQPVLRNAHADTRSALLNLGFPEQTIDRALAELDETGQTLDVSGEIRWVLKNIKK